MPYLANQVAVVTCVYRMGRPENLTIYSPLLGVVVLSALVGFKNYWQNAVPHSPI